MANITDTILVPKSLEDLQDILQNDTKVKVAGQFRRVELLYPSLMIYYTGIDGDSLQLVL